jgi:large subunit ribosomal protein L9
MKIILLRDVSGVGQRGTVKEVADGYALNRLIPGKMAQMATPEALKLHEKRLMEDAAHRAAQEKEWSAIAEKVQKFTLMLRAKADTKGHLYKKISAEEIARLLREQGIDVPEEAIQPKMAIKQTGAWPVDIHLGKKEATMTVEVIAA